LSSQKQYAVNRKEIVMKKFRRIATILLALSLALSIVVIPAAAADNQPPREVGGESTAMTAIGTEMPEFSSPTGIIDEFSAEDENSSLGNNEIDIIKGELTNVTYNSIELDGKTLTFTTGENHLGQVVTITESEDLIVIATEIDETTIDSIEIEKSTQREHTYEYTQAEHPSEVSLAAIQPRLTIGAKDLYWGYSYRVGDAEELEEGLLWDLECGSPNYDSFYGYDDNDSTARAYAEDFMDYVNSMLDHQEAARTINATAIDKFFADIIAICINPTEVVGAIANAADLNSDVREAEDEIVSASRDAEQATYCFRRFIAIAHPLFD